MTETDTPNASEILANELAIEQAHVDKVYDHLETATASARNVEAESRAKFQTDRADWMREEDGTALFERDAFAFQAAKRLAILDAYFSQFEPAPAAGEATRAWPYSVCSTALR